MIPEEHADLLDQAIRLQVFAPQSLHVVELAPVPRRRYYYPEKGPSEINYAAGAGSLWHHAPAQVALIKD